ncbi:aminoacyl-tRNA hydrolase [Patescibacteria group bacterium]|nr:aminoacyl-tRNA hydrolase [Patescibacteria group bacterium]MBU1890168.1 aminoacyl-tRNA hydrolase [Patescibacteria group bacterium]
MKLIVGLGNPGKKYESTRHNIGHMVLNTLSKSLKKKFQSKIKLKSDIIKAKVGKTEIVLAKPTTYMNLSGQAVVQLMNFYKVKPTDIWLVYDDVDIEYGFIKIKPFGSAAGHNGVNSIIKSLGTTKFPRFRVGIKPSAEAATQARYHKLTTSSFVLRAFSPDQDRILEGILDQTADAIVLALEKGLATAMNMYN